MRPIDRVNGAILGLALGDAFGAPYEGGILGRVFWHFIGTHKGKRRWTDDTQMMIDILESLIHCRKVDQNDLAGRFARSYRWSRGHGPGVTRVLRRIRKGESWESAAYAVFKDGSFGNGGAMRSPAIGLFFARQNDDVIAKAADAATIITHAHPLAREGSVQIALATSLAFRGFDPQQILTRLATRVSSPEFSKKIVLATEWIVTGRNVLPGEVAARLGKSITASESCVTAIYVALRFLEKTFEELLNFVINIGGDVDTIAGMAGAIWGAACGAEQLPQEMLKQLEDYVRLCGLASTLAKIM